jgi:hypothetical protein
MGVQFKRGLTVASVILRHLPQLVKNPHCTPVGRFLIPPRVTKLSSKSCSNQHPNESAISLRHHSIPLKLRISS